MPDTDTVSTAAEVAANNIPEGSDITPEQICEAAGVDPSTPTPLSHASAMALALSEAFAATEPE